MIYVLGAVFGLALCAPAFLIGSMLLSRARQGQWRLALGYFFLIFGTLGALINVARLDLTTGAAFIAVTLLCPVFVMWELRRADRDTAPPAVGRHVSQLDGPVIRRRRSQRQGRDPT